MAPDNAAEMAAYKRFEDKFRGSRALIKGRLSTYAPFLEAIERHVGAGATALDIGCGRGEWLEVLAERGWRAVGVDLNGAMIADALACGLDAREADALEHLESQTAESLGLISALHVVEHVPQPYLLKLIEASFRALRPGGIIIFETPNPENLTVGSWSFYLDPSHIKPLPPELLAFLVRDGGFDPVEIVMLNGAPGDPGQGPVETVIWTLFTSGPDYAVVAVKPRSGGEESAVISDIAARVSQPRPGNITHVTGLAGAADRAVTTAYERIESLVLEKIGDLSHAVQQGDARVAEQLYALRQLTEQLDALRQSTEHREILIVERLEAIQQSAARFEREIVAQNEAAHQRAQALQDHLARENAQLVATIAAMRASTSWRLTAPLRGLRSLMSVLGRGPRAVVRAGVSTVKAVARGPVVWGLQVGRRLPWLGRLADGTLGRTPWIGPRLRRFARARGYGLQLMPAGHDLWRLDAAPDAIAHWEGRASRLAKRMERS